MVWCGGGVVAFQVSAPTVFSIRQLWIRRGAEECRVLAETTAALHVLDHGLVEHAEVLQEPRLADKGPLAQLTGPVLEEFLAAELVAHVLAKVGEGAVAQHEVHPGELSATEATGDGDFLRPVFGSIWDRNSWANYGQDWYLLTLIHAAYF